MSVCCTVSEIFNVKEWRDLETGGRSRLLEMTPFEFDTPTSYTTFLLVGHCKYSMYVVPFSSYLTLNNGDLAVSYSPSIVG